MFQWDKLQTYREGNRLEAKRAQGGLPHSLWATYSAFANTQGGVILLGVEELPDKSFRAVGLPDTEKLVTEFWNAINNPQKVSVNLLSDKHLRIMEVDGNQILAIDIPRAERVDKPVYINNDMLAGAYRRNGEGDYHCTKESVRAMFRDAAEKTQDMIVLENMDLSVFDRESLRRYRQLMKINRPRHVWEFIDDEDFLHKLGAVARGEDGHLHPTGAGLLMFGFEYEIVREYPYYFLDYQEHLDASTRWTDRIISSSGEWSGNIFDFYFRVYNRLVQDVRTPFKLENGRDRVDDTPVHKALREILANCLINADYYGPRGLVIIKSFGKLEVANPGCFRIDIREAVSGGASDPRNATLMKMFNLVNIGERAGSGIPNIYAVWQQQGWPEPILTERFSPERTVLSLEFEDKKSVVTDIMTDMTDILPDMTDKLSDAEQDFLKLLLQHYQDHEWIDNTTAQTFCDKSPATIKRYLAKLVEVGVLESAGANKGRRYYLIHTSRTEGTTK